MTAAPGAVGDPAQALGYGFRFRDLYRLDGLQRIDRAFIEQLRDQQPALAGQLLQARAQPLALTRQSEAELLLALGPALEGFIGQLFGISEAIADLRDQAAAAEPFFRVKWKFVRRQAVLQIPAADVEQLDADTLRQELQGWFGTTAAPSPWDAQAFEADFVAAVTRWLSQSQPSPLSQPQSQPPAGLAISGITERVDAGQDPRDPSAALVAQSQERLDAARRYAAWAVQTEAGQRCHAQGRLFRLPQPRTAPPEIAHVVATARQGSVRYSIRPGAERTRDGFALTDDGGPALAAMDEARYCLHCHKQGNDSCAQGLKTAHRPEPVSVSPASGCPLEQRISEFLLARTQGLPVTALALITVENPLCAATGHRICNDCSKACVFQQQTPVDIPRAETRTLRDVLDLPWGFEIYSLLTRWNPLNLKRPVPRPPSGRKVLVAGLGPAGFTLAHHLIQDGHAVFAIDGLKLEPLSPPWINSEDSSNDPDRVDFQPVVEIESIFEPLSTRMPRGFGGVAEYGITVRWDKNFLTLVRLLLERRDQFALTGGVRLGGTLTLDDAFAMGFDHVALATGAGAPAMIEIPGGLARGVRAASDFLMALQSIGAGRRDTTANLQIRMPILVIGGGLTAIDTATEASAYYIVHVERFLDREEALAARHLATLPPSVAPTRSTEDQAIAAEFIAHGRAVRAERAAAAASGRPPNFAPLLAHWGGVTVAYRRSLIESPAYRLNREELASALEEGITIIDHLTPIEVEIDENGAALAVRFRRTLPAGSAVYANPSGPPGQPSQPVEAIRLPARSVFIAAGTRPNTVAATEPGNSPLSLRGQWFLATNELGEPVTPEANPKPAQVEVLAGRREDGRFVSFFGDLHPGWSGSVVRAMASALRGYPVISRVLAHRPPADPRAFQDFARECQSQLNATVVRVQRLAPRILEVVVHAPMAARNFQPGQFFRLQNFESLKPAGAMEPLALTGAWVDRAAGLVGTIVLEMGGSSDLCARMQPGEAVILMGPTGTPTTIPNGETVVLVGGGLGNAVLFSIGAAMRAAGSRVLYFAGYRSVADRFHVADLEAAADIIVWCCDETPGILPSRAQDLAFQGNVVEAMKAYGEGSLGLGAAAPIRLQEADRLLAIGSDRMMAAVARARHDVLNNLLPTRHVALGSVNSPMQCMLKGVCGQCLQLLRDPTTGQTRLIFSCQTQDQSLDDIDFSVLHQRLTQNRLEECQTMHWLGACVLEDVPRS